MEHSTLVEATGMVAGTLTTAAYLPQALKVWRSRSARDISLGMFLMMVTGILLWLIYGLAIGSPALIGANAVTLVLSASILVAKLRFHKF